MSENEADFDGFTRDELQEAFNLVKNPENWKLAINTTVDVPAEELGKIQSAIIFFTGSVPTFMREDGGWHIWAAGYYACIGS